MPLIKNTSELRKHAITACCVVLMLSGCKETMFEQPQVQVSVKPPASSMTIWQARRAVITGLQTILTMNESGIGHTRKVKMHPQSIRVSPGSIEFEADVSTWTFGVDSKSFTITCKFDLKSIDPLRIKRDESLYRLASDENRKPNCVNTTLAWATYSEAQTFADAVNRLRSAAHGEDRGDTEAARNRFRQEAAAWRALPAKPSISEEVRQHRLLAEDAVKERQFDAAVEEYEAGLEINPLWPEGHFNAALLCAELGYYAEGISHMRNYLELLPDAPDAQQARDQIVIWRAKLPKH